MFNNSALQTAAPAGVESGRILSRTLRQNPQHRYLLYVPQGANADAPLLVTVHGISLNAREQIEQFKVWADHYNVILLAPFFTKPCFKDYQRLGRVGRGERADLALQQMISEAARLIGSRDETYFMFGFSGGGQFVHRYAMAYPQKVEQIAIGAAGWYTLPDSGRKFPHGVRAHPDLPSLSFEIGRAHV